MHFLPDVPASPGLRSFAGQPFGAGNETATTDFRSEYDRGERAFPDGFVVADPVGDDQFGNGSERGDEGKDDPSGNTSAATDPLAVDPALPVGASGSEAGLRHEDPEIGEEKLTAAENSKVRNDRRKDMIGQNAPQGQANSRALGIGHGWDQAGSDVMTRHMSSPIGSSAFATSSLRLEASHTLADTRESERQMQTQRAATGPVSGSGLAGHQRRGMKIAPPTVDEATPAPGAASQGVGRSASGPPFAEVSRATMSTGSSFMTAPVSGHLRPTDAMLHPPVHVGGAQRPSTVRHDGAIGTMRLEQSHMISVAELDVLAPPNARVPQSYHADKMLGDRSGMPAGRGPIPHLMPRHGVGPTHGQPTTRQMTDAPLLLSSATQSPVDGRIVLSSETEVTFVAGGAEAVSVPARESVVLPARPLNATMPVPRQLVELVVQQPDRPLDITLNPEDLGRLRLQLTASENGATLLVSADRAETLEMIRRHAQDLVDEFRRQGFGAVSLEFGDKSQGSPSGLREERSTAPGLDEPLEDQIAEPLHDRARQAVANGLDLRM